MSDDSANLREAERIINRLRDKLAESRASRHEPIAVIGFAARTPFESQGVQFWEGLSEGIDASRTVPSDRWDAEAYYDPEKPGKSRTKRGNFLSDVAGFDPAFWSIANVEAHAMDPQQRLALETSWEALCDAGLSLPALAQVQTGVFMGACGSEYGSLAATADLPDALSVYQLTGTGTAIIPGRISYALGLNGPSLLVDTACSSALVATHLACDSLRARTSDVALAGAVNVIVNARANTLISRMNTLSTDGRCRAFDAKGTGLGRGEGCGVVVLKRLSDALRDGDRVLAVIRGSAVNHDGRSDGLTAPSGPAQQAVLRDALAFAKLTPADIQYVEAHGTGTVLGDPIEVEALSAVFSAGHTKASPLLIGSIKSNIGHLEGAAGIAGLIKLVLSVQHREIPPSLHFSTPNPHIAWDHIPVRVQKKLGPWPEPDKPLIAGVSSFGISGTNAHVIVSEPPTEDADAWKEADRMAREAKLLPLCISAKTPAALRAYAKRYADYLSSPLAGATTWRDVAYTASARQTHHEHRLVVVGSSASDWADKLRAYAESERRWSLTVGEASGGRSRAVFVFPGHGSQWLGMGRSLLESSAVFRDVIDRCDAAFRPFVDWSLRDELFAEESKSRLSEFNVIQPLLFAFQIGLAAVWESQGVVPDAVIGHSMGEVAAAYVAGALTLEDAARVICVRSKLLNRIQGHGSMVSIELPMAETEAELAAYGGKISVASSNSPRMTIVSGEPKAVAELVAALTKREVTCRPVNSDVAGHCSQIDELKDELLRELAALRPTEPTVRFVSTALADSKQKPSFDAAYWWSNMRDAVRLAPRVTELLQEGHELFVELSPQPWLSLALHETFEAAQKPAVVVASNRLQKPESEMVVEALGALHVAGYPVNWQKFFGARGRVVSLPSYPWQRERYWIPISKAKNRDSDSEWSLVHRHYTSSEQAGKHIFELELDISDGSHSYLADHKVQGLVVFPAAAYVELALEAASQAFEGKVASLAGLQLSNPLPIADGEARLVQLVVQPEKEGTYALRFSSRPAKEVDAPWTEHARGRLVVKGEKDPLPPVTLAEVQKRCTREVDVAALYESYETASISYGPAFQGVSEAWSGDGEALSKLEELPKLTEHVNGYVVHPALLDAAFQVAVALSGQAFVHSSVGSLRVHSTATPRWAYVKERSSTDAATTVDVLLFDDSGRVAVEVEELRGVPLGKSVGKGRDGLDDWLFEMAWRSSTVTEGDAKGRWLVFSDEQGVGAALRSWIEARGGEVVTVTRGSGFTKHDATHYEVDPLSSELIARLLKEAYGKSGPKKIVSLFGLDTRKTAAAPLNEDALQRAQELSVTSTLHLSQALAQVAFGDPPRLFLVTRGCQPATGSRDVVRPEQALAWGFGATLAHEMADLKTTLVDMDEATSAESLGRELAGADDESRVALRGSERLVARLTRHRRPNAVFALRPLKVSAEEGYALDLLEPGRPESLTLRPLSVPKPGPGQVVIKTRASGVDLRDVRIARGENVEAGAESARLPIGRECAGIVHALGEGVTTVRVGDEVVGMGAHGFDAYVIASSDLVVKKPASLDFEQAAAMPAAVMTALHSVETVGRLRKGERILVHAAPDGVWLAAIQYAKHVGAEIYATAATEDQRAYLRARGVEHVYDSRTDAWADEVRRDTGGRGVDLVVDSLGGDAGLKAVSALAPFGRFVELATGDASAEGTPAISKLRNITVNVLSLSQLLLEHREASRDLLREAFRLVNEGVFHALPVESFSISQVTDAFEQLARVRPIGKVVVRAEESVMARDPSHAAQVASDKTYLVTGGLGALGLIAAARLAKMGAKHVALMGRNGPSETAKSAIRELEAQGASVHVVLADVAQRSAVERALAELSRSAPPVVGLIHAASVTEDAPMPKLTAARAAAVLAPKVAGAFAITSLLPDLEMRVYFSSTAGVVGEAGKSHNAAASAFLDAFTSHLQAGGKPAVSLDWSPIGDSEAPTDRHAIAFLTRLGLTNLTGLDAGELFERLATSSKAQLLTIPFDFHQWRAANPRVASFTVLREIFTEPSRSTAKKQQKSSNLLGKLRATAVVADRVSILIDYLRNTIANVVQSTPEHIGLSVPFKQLGFDSLMVVRLKNTVERDLGMPVPAPVFFAHPTIERLSAHLVEKLSAPAEAAKAAPARPAPKAPAPAPAKAATGETRTGDNEELSLAEQLRLGEQELDDD